MRIVAVCCLLLIVCTFNVKAEEKIEASVARYGNATLAISDWRAVLDQMSVEQRTRLKDDARAREGLATDLLLRRSLAERATREVIDRDPEMALRAKIGVDRVLSDIYLEHAERAGINDEKLEALALEEFRAFPERYRKDRLLVRHILVMRHPSCQNDPRQRIDELAGRLEKGESFEELAKVYSDDANSAAKGGDLGWIERGRTVKSFEEAAFALKNVGEISPPVTTNFGIHLIQLVERRPAEKTEFKDLKPEIVQALKMKQRKEIREKIMEAFKSAPEFQLDDEALKRTLEQIR